MIFPVPPRHSYGKEEVAYWEDFLTQEDLGLLLNRPEWAHLHDARIGGSGNGGQINTSIRETNICWMGLDQHNAHIWNKFAEVVANVNRQFFNYDLTGFYEPAQFGLYSADRKSHYTWHCDSAMTDSGAPRKLSMVLCLDDPTSFDGGHLEVKSDGDDPKQLQLKQGRAWFFPSYVLHRVTPVTRGIRRSLVLWVGGPEFR